MTFAGDNFLETLSSSSAIDGLLNTNKEAPAAPEEEPGTPALPFTNPFSQIIDQLYSNNAAPENAAAAPAEPEPAAP